MPDGRFAIFPERDYRDGLNIWIGHTGNCIWVGEEHESKWCTPSADRGMALRVCPLSGMRSKTQSIGPQMQPELQFQESW